MRRAEKRAEAIDGDCDAGSSRQENRNGGLADVKLRGFPCRTPEEHEQSSHDPLVKPDQQA